MLGTLSLLIQGFCPHFPWSDISAHEGWLLLDCQHGAVTGWGRVCDVVLSTTEVLSEKKNNNNKVKWEVVDLPTQSLTPRSKVPSCLTYSFCSSRGYSLVWGLVWGGWSPKLLTLFHLALNPGYLQYYFPFAKEEKWDLEKLRPCPVSHTELIGRAQSTFQIYMAPFAIVTTHPSLYPLF